MIIEIKTFTPTDEFGFCIFAMKWSSSLFHSYSECILILATSPFGVFRYDSRKSNHMTGENENENEIEPIVW